MDVQLASAVSKAEYARLKNVSRQRVGQWLKEGKIGREALIGDGPAARINVAVADEHLNRNLDLSQRIGLNGIDTRICRTTEPLLLQSPTAPIDNPSSAGTDRGDPIEEQIKRARLEGLERDNRKKAEDEAARAGRYTDTDAAAQQMGRIAGSMLTTFEGALAELATATAAHFKLPTRDVLHLMRTEFRRCRAAASACAKDQADTLPALIDDDGVNGTSGAEVARSNE